MPNQEQIAFFAGYAAGFQDARNQPGPQKEFDTPPGYYWPATRYNEWQEKNSEVSKQ